MLIGRYWDSTPLELAERQLVGTEVSNDFDYRTDLKRGSAALCTRIYAKRTRVARP